MHWHDQWHDSELSDLIMRISSGILKGRSIGNRRIFSGKSGKAELRPTSAKVREALFDILRGDITGASFLDLYAGSGAVGFEAISRGAGRVCFVEDDRQRAKEIQEVIKKTGLSEKASVHNGPALGFLTRADMDGLLFDIVFADPPYASGEFITAASMIDKSPLLPEGGTLVIEHASKKPLDDSGLQYLRLVKNYRYGDTMLTRYRKVT